eukprot:TRINITY_DN6243_c0_g1_i3.p1 TRINITY_DN6243_c0_g1~~TRINITY_DN6243_c0_g1_i3.p1  ORF type:complete len:534 (+),score=93.50 TRINITY_DN6243_c0_g1_i3:119-1720(+)
MENTKEKLHILHFNDAYSIQEYPAGEVLGGCPRFVGAINSFESVKPLKFTSGDLFSPSDLSLIFEGDHMVPALNEMHLTAGYVKELIKKTNFPWVLSNIFERESRKPLAFSVEHLIVENAGYRVGVIGLGEKDWLDTLITIDDHEVLYYDFIEVAREWTQRLKREHQCDLVIALTHMRVPNDQKLAREVPELDLILGGHDHIIHIEQIGDVLFVKSGSDFRHLGHICIETTSQPPASLEKNQFFLRGRYLATVEMIPITKQFEPDPIVAKHVALCMEDYKKEMGEIIGFTSQDLEGRFSFVRTQETNLGNFIADIAIAYTDADFFVGNSGTIRIDAVIPKGPITLGDVKRILPYEDFVEVCEIPGAHIKEVLEAAVSKYPALEGRFPMVGHIQFAFDPKAEPGNRVLADSIFIKGEKLKPAFKYKLASKQYLISGGKDGYAMLPKYRKVLTEENGIELAKIFLHFFGYKPKSKVKEEDNNSDEMLRMKRTNSLSRRTKCIENSLHLIKDVREFNGKSLMEIGPVVEGRLRINA